MQKFITKDDLKSISLKTNRTKNQQPKQTIYGHGCKCRECTSYSCKRHNKWRQKI